MPPFPRRPLTLLLGTLMLLALAALVSPSAAQAAPIEDYPSYQAGDRCRPQPKPGTVHLGRWMVRTFGGSYGNVARACSDATSEHEEGRAFDWTLDATKQADRQSARSFLVRIFATDRRGHEHALARRMGIMYVIWNDRIVVGVEHLPRGGLPQLELRDEEEVLGDPAPPRPPARLADPSRRAGGHELVRGPAGLTTGAAIEARYVLPAAGRLRRARDAVGRPGSPPPGTTHPPLAGCAGER